MTMTDPVADMLTRIRNANTAMHDDVAMPSSKLKESLAALLHKEGYINAFNVSENEEAPGKTLTIEMKYSPSRARVISGIKRVSKPGLRVYSKSTDIPSNTTSDADTSKQNPYNGKEFILIHTLPQINRLI